MRWVGKDNFIYRQPAEMTFLQWGFVKNRHNRQTHRFLQWNYCALMGNILTGNEKKLNKKISLQSKFVMKEKFYWNQFPFYHFSFRLSIIKLNYFWMSEQKKKFWLKNWPSHFMKNHCCSKTLINLKQYLKNLWILCTLRLHKKKPISNSNI